MCHYQTAYLEPIVNTTAIYAKHAYDARAGVLYDQISRGRFIYLFITSIVPALRAGIIHNDKQ